MGFIHHAHFQRGGAPQNLLGARRVLYARQLHHHAVQTFLLDHRFGDTQFVHPVAQGQQVLLYCGFLYALRRLRLERDEQVEFLACILVVQGVIGIALLDFGFTLAARICIAELHHQRIAVPIHAGIRDILFAQRAAYVFGGCIQRFGQCGLHVHLQQEMHTAAQIQAQIHRQCVQVGQPPRRTRQQIQRNHIIIAQLFGQHVLGLQLVVGAAETGLDAVVFQHQQFRGQIGRLEDAPDTILQCGIRFHAGAQRRDLHRRGFTVQIRQGINQSGQQRGQDQQIFP